MAGYNDILLYENPNENPTENPKRRRRRRRRNVAGVAGMRLPKTMRQYVDVNVAEIVAATGGLAAATMIPATFIKDTSTNLRKLSKLGVSLLAAAGAAAVAEAFAKRSGRAALFGGIAGTGVMSLAMFTNITIGQPQLITGTKVLNLGESRVTRGQATDEGIQISTT